MFETSTIIVCQASEKNNMQKQDFLCLCYHVTLYLGSHGNIVDRIFDIKVQKNIRRRYSWFSSYLRFEISNECYSTVTCKVLLNQPQCKVGQHWAARCSILTRRHNRSRARLALLCTKHPPLNKGESHHINITSLIV